MLKRHFLLALLAFSKQFSPSFWAKSHPSSSNFVANQHIVLKKYTSS